MGKHWKIDYIFALVLFFVITLYAGSIDDMDSVETARGVKIGGNISVEVTRPATTPESLIVKQAGTKELFAWPFAGWRVDTSNYADSAGKAGVAALAEDAELLNGQNDEYYLSRNNHTGALDNYGVVKTVKSYWEATPAGTSIGQWYNVAVMILNNVGYAGAEICGDLYGKYNSTDYYKSSKFRIRAGCNSTSLADVRVLYDPTTTSSNLAIDSLVVVRVSTTLPETLYVYCRSAANYAYQWFEIRYQAYFNATITVNTESINHEPTLPSGTYYTRNDSSYIYYKLATKLDVDDTIGLATDADVALKHNNADFGDSIGNYISGTTNYGAKFTGDNTIGNSLVYYGDSVGINTNTPQSMLHVKTKTGALNFNSGIHIQNNLGDYTVAQGAGVTMQNSDVYVAGVYGIREANNWQGALSFYTHNSSSGNTFGTSFVESMRISSAGNVGIGTTTPTTKLDVNGNIRSSGDIYADSLGIRIIRLSGLPSGGTGDSCLILKNGVPTIISASSYRTMIGAASAAHGITTYHVPYATSSTSWGTSPWRYEDGKARCMVNFLGDSAGSSWSIYQQNSDQVLLLSAGTPSENRDSGATIQVEGVNSFATDAGRGNGNIWLTTAYIGRLWGIANSFNLTQGGDDTLRIYHSADSGYVYSAKRHEIVSSAGVGTGLNIVENRVTAVDSLILETGIFDSYGIPWLSGDINRKQDTLSRPGNEFYMTYVNPTFGLAGNQFLRVLPSPWDVMFSGDDFILRPGTIGYRSQLIFDLFSDARTVYSLRNILGKFCLLNSDTTDARDANGFQSDSTLLAVGKDSTVFYNNVKIVDKTLTIDNAGTYNRLYFKNAATTLLDIGVYNSHKIFIAGKTNGPMGFETNGVERFFIDSIGRIGIGTSSPRARLDVSSNNACLYLGSTTGTTRTDNTTKYGKISSIQYDNDEEGVCVAGVVNDATHNYIYIGGGSNDYNAATDILFFTAINNTTLAGTERLRINGSGNIGIGTSSITERLTVDGNVSVSGNISATTTECDTLKVDKIKITGDTTFTPYCSLYVGSSYITRVTADIQWRDSSISVYIENLSGSCDGSNTVYIRSHGAFKQGLGQYVRAHIPVAGVNGGTYGTVYVVPDSDDYLILKGANMGTLSSGTGGVHYTEFSFRY